MKKELLAAFVVIFSNVFGQVGINTTNPQGIFHIDGSKDNPVIGIPSTVQQSNDFAVVSSSGLGIGTITVGIGTTNPTERLDIANGNIRIRDIGTHMGNGASKLLVADDNGVLKIAGGEPFSIDNSGNRMLYANGGPNMNASTDWSENIFTPLKLAEQYDPLNAYDAGTGVFTVPSDGLYYMYGVCGFMTPSSGSGVFDGTSGDAFTTLMVDGTRTATSSAIIHRGTKNPAKSANLYFLVSNVTVWLKAGQRISLQFLTFGTNNMVGSLSDLTIDKPSSRLIINKLL